MSSNSVKFDSAKKWHRRLGHLNQADVVRKAPETVGELNHICNACALAKTTKTPVPRVTETQAEEKWGCSKAGEDVHRRDGIFQSKITVRVSVPHCVCRSVHEVSVCELA